MSSSQPSQQQPPPPPIPMHGNLPPPPPPPPPPLPGNMVLPLPPPPPPMMNMALPPPMVGIMPPGMAPNIIAAAPPGGQLAATNNTSNMVGQPIFHHPSGPTTIVLLHVPEFLMSGRALRDLIYPCGACRSVAYCSNIHTTDMNLAVVKMTSPKGAMHFARHWKCVSQRLQEEETEEKKEKMKCFLVMNNSTNILQNSSNMEMMMDFLIHEEFKNSSMEQHDESIILKLVETYTAVKQMASMASNVPTMNPLSQSTQSLPTEINNNYSNGANNSSSPNDNDGKVQSQQLANSSSNSTELPESKKIGDDVNIKNSGGVDGIIQTKLDVSKVAAAAGGGAYDEEADPLNAPEVLEAVALFKKRLEQKDSAQKKKRKEIVDKKLKHEIEKFKNKIRESKKQAQLEEKQLEQKKESQEEESANQNNTSGTSTTTTTTNSNVSSNVVDTGVRGVSNLPSWMTKQQQTANNGTTSKSTSETADADDKADTTDDATLRKRKFVPSEANRDINVRKQRLDIMGDGNHQSLAEIRAANEAADSKIATTKEEILKTVFPLWNPEMEQSIRTFVISQIVEYLGEEEDTMIDFVMKHLQKDGDSTVTALLEEMKMVLDEDAEAFVVDLYKHVTHK